MHGVEIWDKVNESAKVIVWPGVVAFAMVLFRARLSELFKRLREAATPAGTVKFDPSEVEATSAIAASAGALVERIEAEIQSGAEPLGEGPQAAESSEARTVDLREIRDDVEAVIKTSFAAGYRSGRSAEKHGSRADWIAYPIIRWIGSTPTVKGTRHKNPEAEVPEEFMSWLDAVDERGDVEDRVEQLTAEIRSLEAQRASAGETESERFANEIARVRAERDIELAALPALNQRAERLRTQVNSRGWNLYP
ncbi:hypothetical protein OG474_29320 [Kribbella sp. NBC_01505]|uniref:hypothetical protein n=1 Tax=Kribbella sp. NBC_01505 TaxID=2903580 RepID=UPI00387078F9